MRASVEKVGGGEGGGVPSAGDGTGAAWSGGEGEPALDGKVETVPGEAYNLVDSAPGPVTWAAEESPELPRAGSCWVPRPRLRDRWEGGKGEFR